MHIRFPLEFSKLTLSSSNHKQQKTQQPLAEKPLTPTPKMLSYSDAEDSCSPAEITDDDEDERPPAAVAPQISSLLVNKILASSSSPSQSPAAPDACEGASFSQRLQLNDTDVTKCTELDQRRSSILPVPPTAAAEAPFSQMERLEVTGSSEDLFDGVKPSSSSELSPNRLTEAISDLSQRIDRIQLLEMSATEPAPAAQRRQTVYTISSSSSNSGSNCGSNDVSLANTPASQPTRRGQKQVSTRSSLSSDDVYDVITLSDSQSEDEADAVPGPPVAETTEDRLCNVSEVATRNGEAEVAVSSSQAKPASAAESLPSVVQQQLDKFFDNIPLVESNESERPNDVDKGSFDNNSILYSIVCIQFAFLCRALFGQ